MHVETCPVVLAVLWKMLVDFSLERFQTLRIPKSVLLGQTGKLPEYPFLRGWKHGNHSMHG